MNLGRLLREGKNTLGTDVEAGPLSRRAAPRSPHSLGRRHPSPPWLLAGLIFLPALESPGSTLPPSRADK